MYKMMIQNEKLKQLNLISQQVMINHYFHTSSGLLSLFPSKNISTMEGNIHVSMQFIENNHGMKIVEIIVGNSSKESVLGKLLVESRMVTNNERIVFVSPKKDVLFHSDEEHLCLTSGVWKGKSIRQYAAFPIDGKLQKRLKSGDIGICPIGKGNISGIFTLEAVLEPGEISKAYTWAISSNSEKTLLQLHEMLQKQTSFSNKKMIL
jgi:hypothetical protein